MKTILTPCVYPTMVLLIASPIALGQGDLAPPNGPAPTMKSLQQIWDKAVMLESQSQAQQQQIAALQQRNTEQSALLGVLLEKNNVELPWWRITTVDSGGIVGDFASLAFTPDGQPAISYYDQSNTALKYAVFNGVSWQLTTVDNSGSVGQHTSLKFSPSGQAAISYYDAGNADLKFAIFNGSSWQISVVDSGGDVGIDTSLGFAPGGRPAISYHDRTHTNLKYAVYDGSTWQASTVDSNGDVGYSTSLDFSPSGNPAISYIAGAFNEVRYAMFDGFWGTTTIEIADFTEDLASPSLKFSASGQAVVCYESYDFGASVKIAKFSSGFGWEISSLSGQIFSASDWGYNVSLAFTPSGQPAVSWTQDPFNPLGYPKLGFASFNGSTWQGTIADSTPGVGYSSSLAFNPGGLPAIAYYDSANGNLKFSIRSPFIKP